MTDHVTHHDDCGCRSAALKDELIVALRERNDAHLRIATLEAELAEEADTRTRMGDILTLTVNALKGEPDSRSLHDWATLPEVARTLVASNNALRDALVRKNMALRVMVEEAQSFSEFSKFFDLQRAMDAALAECADMAAFNATPAQSLAAHDAEVGLRVAEMALAAALKEADEYTGDSASIGCLIQRIEPAAIVERALAAQEAHNG